MLTWQGAKDYALESTRVLLGPTGGLRALGRMVRAVDDDEPFTASYRVITGEGGHLGRVSLTTATAGRERHLTLNRTEDGVWLLDTGSGGTRSEFGGAQDIDLAFSPLFNTLPIRRLGLHQARGQSELTVVFVTLPELGVEVVEQGYRTVATSPEGAVVEFSWEDFSAELRLDPDGLVIDYPSVATRV
jgi:uncharacterized protein